ncbi:MAG TPA: phosphoglucomutase (alpha-D-glucose-1,6-bisphosphate-dependent) [Bryobacteraceae bacterium]|jgi:phosphoglucomutase|nr:phosphoglucomutase (alpha-D-glucose-1,6-bisphosphate-dependent) [Bryobacteraceae bacterium]
MPVDPRAGEPAQARDLINIPRLVTAYFAERPARPVVFGTSGHRGSPLEGAFNEWHILAITQAICENRRQNGIGGPLYLGFDTHALSEAAFASALEVLAANEVEVRIAPGGEYTPTPAVSHAILAHNRGREKNRADGIVITPSHNPPEDGGFKYNPPHGGPADSKTTACIQNRANEILKCELAGVRRVPFARALKSPTTKEHDFIAQYTGGLRDVIDMDAIRGVNFGIDPLGGAGVHYWGPIAEKYKLKITVVNDNVDPAFRFMTLDWDGRIRMDPSSPYAMRALVAMKDKFDVAAACDTDHDRHGIVTRRGLMPPNHYLSVCVDYLYRNRPGWSASAAAGKTVVSSSMIDRVAAGLGRKLFEVPVGFKFFVDGLLSGSIAFGGEESAGASFLDRRGAPWSTDKDGIIAALLAAEITARAGRDPADYYESLCEKYGAPVYERIDAPANATQREALAKLSPSDIAVKDLAGEKIQRILTHAPGDGNPIGGVKVVAENGWFAARPSGTEDVYKIYAESFRGVDHLTKIQCEAREIVAKVLRERAR